MKITILLAIAFTVSAFQLHAEEPKSAKSIESALQEKMKTLERGPEARAKAMEIFKASIDEIDTYLKASPDAKDKTQARVLQAQLLNATGQKEKVEPMLAGLYKDIAKGKDGDLDSAVPLVAMQAQALLGKGDKKGAKDALDSFEKDFSGHADMDAKGSRMLQSMRGQLNLPGVGDTMEIAFTALDGKKVDLAAMKDKVVLVDFWATWCGPCVGELPNVKKAYEAYHAKGFEIIGISLDQEKDTLESFLKKEGMTWAQAFDGKGWQNELATKFGIHSIPATFLVGKDGKVVATNLRGDALEKKLAELIK